MRVFEEHSEHQCGWKRVSGTEWEKVRSQGKKWNRQCRVLLVLLNLDDFPDEMGNHWKFLSKGIALCDLHFQESHRMLCWEYTKRN